MKKFFKFIPLIIAIIATAVIVTVIVKKNKVNVDAAYATLPGIEKLYISNNNAHPYTILEVVPDKYYAKFGYLVGGEESIDNGRSIKDMPAKAEREAKMAAFAGSSGSISSFTGLVNDGALSYSSSEPYSEVEGGATTYEVHGTYADKENGDYQYTMTPPVYVPWNSVGTGDKYTMYMDWSFGSDFGITFGQIIDQSSLVINDGGTEYKINRKYEISEDRLDASTILSKNGVSLFEMMIDGSAGADPSKLLYIFAGTILVEDTTVYRVTPSNDMIPIYTDGTTVDEYFGEDALYTALYFTRNDVYGDYTIRSFTAAVANGGFDKDIYYEVNNEEEDSKAYALSSTQTDNTEYMPGAGNKTFVPDTTAPLVSTFAYNNGIVNNEWLKKYTFDLSSGFNDFVIDVKTVTMDEFDAIDLAGVNMVVLSGGDYGQDMSVSQAQSLLKEAIQNKLPVIVESGFDSYADFSSRPNNFKVYTALRQSGISGLNYSSIVSSWDISDFWNASSTGLKNKMRSISAANYAYVDCNVLVVYGSIVENFKTDVADSLKKTANNWLTPVLDEINSENFYRQNAGVAQISTTVSKATAIRYIINYASQRAIVKSKIKVLEIEPCYSFGSYVETGTGDNSLLHIRNTNTNGTTNLSTLNRKVLSTDYIANNWATQFKDSQSNISLKQMSSSEFIGHVEDLNENYDLIYIGLDTSTMTTTVSGTTKTTNTIYNDSTMNGRVYSHVGDVIEDVTGKEWSIIFGLIDILTKEDTSKLYWDGKYENIYKQRLSGNDITYEKLMALEEFIKAGYPVVFADDFFAASGNPGSSINTTKIDPNSNMYKLVRFAQGLDGSPKNYTSYNVFCDSQIKNSAEYKKKLADYLNISKLSVTMLSQPTPYSKSGSTTTYLSATGGRFVLIYDFVLKNEAAIGIYDNSYNVSLYIDTTVDGRFSSDEEIPSIHLYDISSGSEVELVKNGASQFEMYAGRTYRIRREVPDGYVGVLPWKLVFTQNDNSLIRISTSGYTAVPIPNERKQELKVLQIGTQDGTDTIRLDNDGTVRELLNEVQDFKVSISYIKSKDLLNLYTRQSDFYSYLNAYDMLIFGFSDMYEFGITDQQSRANECCKAIKQYINDGKSVLFSHDTTSFFNRGMNFWNNVADYIKNHTLFTKTIIEVLFGESFLNRYWGYSFNTFLRPVAGMDRFNATGNKNAGDKVDYYRTSAGDNLSQGYSNIILLRFNDQSGIKRTSSRLPFYSSDEQVRGGHYDGTYSITSLNKGQITTYPFEIADNFQISKTHGQYYQLNLDTDPWDSNTNDDVVVWYCITDINGGSTDDIYQATYQDARNNYYIYSNGNVMYSGMGHSAPNREELKLFINTMVASYQAGAHAPTVKYLSEEEGAYEINTTYIPYDEALNEYIDTTDVSCNFIITDNSFIKSIDTYLENEYLIEVPQAQSTKSITYNGETVYVKNITSTANVKKTNGSNVSDKTKLDLDTPYTLTVSVDTIKDTFDNNTSSPNLANAVRIFVGAKTHYKLASGKTMESSFGYYSMTVIRTSLFDLE